MHAMSQLAATRAQHAILRTPTPTSSAPAVKIAYIMSRVPKLTETFMLYPILPMEKCGVGVEIYALVAWA